MLRNEFSYFLPDELIAQYPPVSRTDSRLLLLDPQDQSFNELRFADIIGALRPDDLLVFNDTKVIPARLLGQRPVTGGKVEVLIDRMTGVKQAVAYLRASKRLNKGALIELDEGECLEVVAKRDDLYEIAVVGDATLSEILYQQGHVPLPPYIKRSDEMVDSDRYQTVYASREGAVAAPTAGLHFDQDLLAAIRSVGVQRAFVTLHVGSGTFQPMRCERVEEHIMHAEHIEISEKVVQQVEQAKERGGRVIAVGTTAVRCLEFASKGGLLRAYKGDAQLFIYPGYHFNCVDALITNFHLPESTLLMLVCAFAGKEYTLSAYQHAVKENFKFFSYGDAMFIQHRCSGQN